MKFSLRTAVAACFALEAVLGSSLAQAQEQCSMSDAAHSAIERICPTREGMARIRIGGAWGYISAAGQVAIEPQFDQAYDFSEGLAAVERDERWGLIDRQGRWVVEPRFTDLSSLSHGLAAAEMDGKWGYLDRSGQWAIEPRYERAGPFNGDTAMVSEGYQHDLMIDKAGRVIQRFPANVTVRLEPNIFRLYSASLKHGDLLQHRDGKTVPQPREAVYAQYSEGLLLAASQVKRGEDKVELKGTVDFKGKWITPPKFRSLELFHGGLAIASPDAHTHDEKERFGLINRQGEFVVKPIYQSIRRDDLGLYRASHAEPGPQGSDVFNAKGERIASTDCEELKTVSLILSNASDWEAMSGCGQTWVFHRDGHAINSKLAHVDASATAEHLLLRETKEYSDDSERPTRFELFNAAGKRVLSSDEIPLTDKYDSVALIAASSSRHAQQKNPQLPLALIIRGYKQVQIVTSDYKLISNPQWQYDRDMNGYDRHGDEQPLEGPLPLKTDAGWGAVDSQGRWVVQPRYSRLSSFRNGVAFAARLDYKELMVDQSGKEHEFPEDGRQFERVAPMVLEGHTNNGQSIRLDLLSSQQTISTAPDDVRVEGFNGRLAAAEKGGQWGLIDPQGRWVVQPTYTGRIEAVVNDKTKTLVGWKTSRYIKTDRGTESLYGWLDAQGVERAAPVYSEMRFDEAANALFVDDGGSKGVMALDGKVLIEPIQESISYLGDGWYATRQREQQGLIDATGQWAVQPGSFYFSDMHDRLFRKIQVGENIVVYDAQGRVSTRAKPLTVSPDVSESWWPETTDAYSAEEQTIFYGADFQKRVRIPGRVESYARFSEDVIVFSPTGQRDKLGLADASGTILGLYPYERIEPMTNGFAIFKSSVAQSKHKSDHKHTKRRPIEVEPATRYGYLNRNGQLALAPIYEDASHFSEQRATVVLLGNLGLIDTKGKLLVHGAWLCGRHPVILDSNKKIAWPREFQQRKKC